MYLSGRIDLLGNMDEKNFILNDYINSYQKIGFLISNNNFVQYSLRAFDSIIDVSYPNFTFFYLTDTDNIYFCKMINSYKIIKLTDYNLVKDIKVFFIINDMFIVKYNFITRILSQLALHNDFNLFIFNQKKRINGQIIIEPDYNNFLIRDTLIMQSNSLDNLSALINMLIKNKKYYICDNIFTYSKYYINCDFQNQNNK